MSESEDTRLEAARAFYARLVAAGAGRGELAGRIESAFAFVPREHFLGRGPWSVPRFANGGPAYVETPNADPILVYQNILFALDREKGGLNSVHKYLEIDTAEYLLRRASKGDAAAKEQVLKTLKANENLLDPVWGGIYQYSVHSVWTNPHYEKLITNQSDNIRM